MPSLRAEDDDLLVAYVAGELDQAARVRCEERLANDAEFAQRLLAFEAMDLVGAMAHGGDGDSVVAADAPPAANASSRAASPRSPASTRRSPPSSPFARHRLWLSLCAFAAAAVLVLWLWPPAPAPLVCQVRAVASFAGADLATYAERLGLPPELRYVGESRGNPSSPRRVAAADFLAAAGERERARGDEALQQPQEPLADGLFTLRVQVDRACSALVLQLDLDGRWWRRFPSPPSAPLFAEVEPRLLPGVHTLPRPVAVANATGGVSLHPGFDVPSDQPVARTWLLVVLREEPFDPALLLELDGVLAGDRVPFAGGVQANTSATELDSWAVTRQIAIGEWLAARGFGAQLVVVGR